MAPGQFPDGSQKNGILKYERGKPVGIFDPGTGTYVSLEDFQADVDSKLGVLPVAPQWKSVLISRPSDLIQDLDLNSREDICDNPGK